MYIALLEDDRDQVELIKLWLESAGHQCDSFETAESFMTALKQHRHYDLFILDWMLPDTSGIDVLKWIREEHCQSTPIIFVTARDSEQDIVQALESGADDYMVKPVKQLELIARIAAAGRRAHVGEGENEVLEIGPFRIVFAERAIHFGDETIELTQKEFALAVFLLRNNGKLLSRGFILEKVWNMPPGVNTRTVDTHISRLRNKLHLTPEYGWRLSAVYQHGYRLERLENPEVAA